MVRVLAALLALGGCELGGAPAPADSPPAPAWTGLPSGSSVRLNAIAFSTDALVGYAVGEGGTILKTTNGGASWSVSPSGVAAELLSVSVPTNGTVAYACGAGGRILRTTNQGASWSSQTPVAGTLRAVLFPSSDYIGWCAGDGTTILKTTDGVTWTPQAAPFAADFYAIAAPFTGLTAFACGTNGRLMGTNDGGVVWNDFSPPAAAGVLLRSLAAPSGTTVFAGGANGTIYRSLNGGGFWDAVSPGTTNLALAFAGPNDGFSLDGRIARTANGGTAWAESYASTGVALRGAWVSGSTVFAAGDGGTILKSASGGQ